MSFGYVSMDVAGRVGRDPEFRYTAGGTPVLNFSVAVNTWRKLAQPGEDGKEFAEDTIWFRASVFGPSAERLNGRFGKGAQVILLGCTLRHVGGSPSVYTASNGDARASFEITPRTVQVVSAGAVAAGEVAVEGEADPDFSEPF